jgi:hypothetical protein
VGQHLAILISILPQNGSWQPGKTRTLWLVLPSIAPLASYPTLAVSFKHQRPSVYCLENEEGLKKDHIAAERCLIGKQENTYDWEWYIDANSQAE